MGEKIDYAMNKAVYNTVLKNVIHEMREAAKRLSELYAESMDDEAIKTASYLAERVKFLTGCVKK